MYQPLTDSTPGAGERDNEHIRGSVIFFNTIQITKLINTNFNEDAIYIRM